MIPAEKAHRIMQLYESDYDNFLDKLKAQLSVKKKEAGQKKTEADKAGKTLTEATAHKKTHLAEKAKNLIDKAGGIEGAKSTIQNVMKYFKDNSPSDYQVNMGGKGDDGEEKTIMGYPPVAVYVGAGLLLLGLLYAGSRLMKKNAEELYPGTSSNTIHEQPIVQQAA